MALACKQPKTSDKGDELIQVVRSMIALADELSELLEEERAAMGSGDIAAIDGFGKKKADCVVQLEAQDSRRAQLCRELTLDSDDIDRFIGTFDTPGAPQLWESFLVKLEHCKEANAVNGSFARIRRTHIEKALHILRGAPESAGLYGPDGLDDSKGANHLGRA